MSKHTAGPWKAAQPNGQGMGWQVGPCWLGHDTYSDETAANARLVEAAPEMLAVIKALLSESLVDSTPRRKAGRLLVERIEGSQA